MLKALSKEIEDEKGYLKGEPVDTIYFGGGTPSILKSAEIALLLDRVYSNYSVSSDAEVTLEANPDDISEEKLDGWKAAGINRLSLGLQSFDEPELRMMNRAHTAEESITALQLVLSRFDNVTIDLIYGSPMLTDERWEKNVKQVIDLGIPHLSCYALTVEDKTPLAKAIATHKLADVDPDKQARQFMLLMQWLKEAGYEHYEVSNFARAGYRSRHNSAYWQGRKYLGIGPSAHSFNGTGRRWNVANNAKYIAGIINNIPDREEETLSPEQRLNEYIMIALRTSEGLDLNRVEAEWSSDQKARLESETLSLVNRGLAKKESDTIALTDEGMLLADGIASDLFIL